MTVTEILLAVSWIGCMGAVGAGCFVSGVLVGGRNLAGALTAAAAPIVQAVSRRAGGEA